MHGLAPLTSKLVGALLVLALASACGQSEAPGDAASHAPDIVRVKAADQALEGAQVSTLDPATMHDAEIRQVVGAGAHCTFRYTSSGKPVVVVALDPGGRPATGVIKLNGSLVALKAEQAPAVLNPGEFALVAQPLRVRLHADPQAAAAARPAGSRVEAAMVFEVGQQLKVGYGGYLECRSAPPAPAASQ